MVTHLLRLLLINTIYIDYTYASNRFCTRDGQWCDGGTVRHCISGYEVFSYKCVSACVSGTCIGASLFCQSQKNGPGYYCNANHKILCGSDNSISGYEYCELGCVNGQCIGNRYTDCFDKSRGCSCDNTDLLGGNVICCYPNVLMFKIDCATSGCNITSDTRVECINRSLQNHSIHNVLYLCTLIVIYILSVSL